MLIWQHMTRCVLASHSSTCEWSLRFNQAFWNVPDALTHRIFSWDDSNPTDKSRWYTMHDALIPFDPPHVYHVVRYGSPSTPSSPLRQTRPADPQHQHDREGLQKAVIAAASTQIDRFIRTSLVSPLAHPMSHIESMLRRV